ncbi:MAG: glycoside hydrolase family 43 protein [Acidimicrobiia bacterium]
MHTRRAFALLVIAVLVLGACRRLAPAPPPLPTAPVGVAANPISIDLDPDPAVANLQQRDAPDPFVFSVDPAWCDTGAGTPPACFYAYSTQVKFNLTPVYRSTDLVDWQLGGYDSPDDADALPNGAARSGIASWAEFIGHWAPSVLERPSNPTGRFVMWYSAVSNVAPTAGYHCLGVAVADSPGGPFIDDSTAPAYCQTNQGGSIDPSFFVDSDGTAYLQYKTEGRGSAPVVPTRIWTSKLAPDGRSVVAGSERLLLEVDRAAGSWENPIVEGPSLARTPAGLFLFYSAYHWETNGYKVGVARCDSVVGPCRRVYRTPVLASRSKMWGPGGQSLFADAAGNWYLAFHAWAAPTVGYGNGGMRTLRILPLSFATGAPAVG